jgi:hypothetical protein
MSMANASISDRSFELVDTSAARSAIRGPNRGLSVDDATFGGAL